MPGPQAPDTIAVVQSIKTLLTNLKLSDGVTPAYQTVTIGALDDYTQVPLPCATIIIRNDDSERRAFGGTINEDQAFEIRSIVDYTNKSAAELQIMAIRDVLMLMLQKYGRLPDAPTAWKTKVEPGSARFGYMVLKPNWYRIHKVNWLISQTYMVPGGIQ